MSKSLYRPEAECLTRELRRARLDAGLTQEQLAERLSRSQSFVSKVEAGERRMDVIEFREMCLALGVSPVEMMQRLEAAIQEECQP